MGYGDQLMATGLARGAAARGKRIAFGDGSRIIWDHNSEEIFRGNPNIALPADVGARNIEWVSYYKGKRNYNRLNNARDRWLWNYDFKPVPGQLHFDAAEKLGGKKYGNGFVVIEAGIESWKSVAPNKDWGVAKYQAVADQLKASGYHVVQFLYGKSGAQLRGVQSIATSTFRHALTILGNAALYLGAEGGLHHASAALGVKAVVIFGGFVPPAVTGYDEHINLTGGAEACGSLNACAHCRASMEAISVDEVSSAALGQLKQVA